MVQERWHLPAPAQIGLLIAKAKYHDVSSVQLSLENGLSRRKAWTPAITMIANHDRTKLVNAIVYFGQHTKKCGMTKLFKLLYFLDFEHYKKTGGSVTGLKYFAWPMGPVPVSLKEELNQPEADLNEKIFIREVPTRFEQPLRLIEAKAEFDPAHFSKREIRLLKELANEYKDSSADEMIEATHLETLPWHRVFEDEKRRQAEIPYEYVLRPDEAEMMEHVSTGNREISENYR